MPTPRRAAAVLLCLIILAAISLGVGLVAGSVPVTLEDLVNALDGGSGGMGVDVVRGLRLPRVLGAFACGGLLALAGTLMQVLLRNPLADPYVLGISGGAGVGAMFAMLMGFSLAGVNGLAFAGAVCAMLMVFGLSHGDGSWTQTRLLLTGVIVASGCGALVALMLSIAPEQKLHGMLFWLMGDLSHVMAPRLPLAILVLALAAIMPFARALNLLARGQMQAQALGVSVIFTRRVVYGVASVATAFSVTTAGSIGFVGLVVPHLVRLASGNDQRLLLPAATLAGGSLLVLADTAARTLVAPQQLPVGVLTALIGVPLFLFLLTRQPR